MVSVVNFAFLLLCAAIGYVIPTVPSFEQGFPKDQATPQSESRDSDLPTVEAEYEEFLRRDRALRTTPLKVCAHVNASCGFHTYTDIYQPPGFTGEWHPRCLCPEGTKCSPMIPYERNMRQETYHYVCYAIPTSTEPSESLTSTHVNKRLGSLSVHPEL